MDTVRKVLVPDELWRLFRDEWFKVESVEDLAMTWRTVSHCLQSSRTVSHHALCPTRRVATFSKLIMRAASLQLSMRFKMSTDQFGTLTHKRAYYLEVHRALYMKVHPLHGKVFMLKSVQQSRHQRT
ncbi:hypothetical protein ElyMa_002643900 [Elysia marginata]|uniref:Uncharacterized protein n=1 Tax=Elysia marginata TaxID=1093978 RepID=A0AAV4HA38_9GAST|nr:hypothetical protein ElyMa_002643900 [Elysia marginata]